MRVLVAEDHPTLARSVADGLREEGFAVDLTFNGDEAMRSANNHPYDCVILDIMMPGKTGLQVLEGMRKRGSKTPVLFLTAADAIDDRVRGLNLGADDYVVKPFAFDELVARVRAVIRRGHGQATGPIVVADLEIDTAAKTVRRAAGRSRCPFRAPQFALVGPPIPGLARRPGGLAHRHLEPHLRSERRNRQQRRRRLHRLPAQQDRPGS